jgi:glycosylphosphatidylinositol phospholipase D
MSSDDLNSDGADDLLIGAPVYSTLNAYQSGAVFVVLSKNGAPLPLANLNLQQSADLIIEAPTGAARSRFGHSLTILDINLDGVNDIIVSAPSYMLNKMSYEVIIY